MTSTLTNCAAEAYPHGHVLTGAHARDAFGRAGLATAVRRGVITRLWHDAYVVGPATMSARLAAADLTLGAPARPCLDTAAALHGFDLAGSARIHLLADRDFDSKRPAMVLHRIDPIAPLVQIGGRGVMDPVETAVRLAAGHVAKGPYGIRSGPLGAQRALAVLDASLSAGAVRDATALAEFSESATMRGIRLVRDLVAWADRRAESPRESWLRWIFRDAGLPPPTPQWRVQPRSGRWYRLDLAWPGYKVACEYDGVAFHTGDAMWRDRERLADLTGDGWLMIMATDAMVTRGRSRLVSRVAGLLRSRGASW